MRSEQKELNYNMKLQQLLCLVLSNLFRNSEEMPELVLAGNKLSAQGLQEIKMLQQDNIKTSVPQMRRGKKFRDKIQNFIASDQCQGTMAVG